MTQLQQHKQQLSRPQTCSKRHRMQVCLQGVLQHLQLNEMTVCVTVCVGSQGWQTTTAAMCETSQNDYAHVIRTYVVDPQAASELH